MSLDIILLILVAALLHASWNAVIKGGTNKLYETGLNCFGGGVGVLFVVPFLPLPAPESLIFLAGSCSVHIAYYLCIAVAYRTVDMSFAYTIMRGTAPLLTSIAMLLFGHNLSWAGWLGILCLCSGVLVLTRENVRNGRFNISGALAAVGTAVVIMGYTLFDGYGARASGNPISYVCWLYVINTFPINIILLLRQRKSYIPYFKQRWKIGLFGGLCSLGSYGVALWAMTKAPIAMVAALRETSVIFGMLLAILFLGEKFSPVKLLAVVLVATGIIIMRLQ
ncbi:MAG TPA: DMT family transporter [Candidatus Bilophila faecipullorum]|uniref:DMT family transporter n=1 Tax=Candidatus Bilophila faecipullorum TaxID=2838482 RepID=A0A9D1U8W5_9BACT|nr:DMT family transporter [uncultured Bilophila sp.]HIW78867.1 DMT family transporter [Candidatus Bilophila faecipullorum]